MSLSTRCPACGTTFKVVPDQLKISRGWVRCGHCASLFDAAAHLQSLPPSAPGPTPASNPASASPPAPLVDSPRPRPPAPPMPPSGSPPPRATSAPSAQAAPPPKRSPSPPAPSAPAPRQQAPAAAHRPATTAPSEPESTLREPAFVRQARRQAYWHSAPMRLLQSALAVLLTLSLGLQWAVHEADTLAAEHPAWAPGLHRLCAMLGCQVNPVRRINDITIDSASLLRRQGQRHDFELVLLNTAAIPLATPALELSLTNMGDQVIARRVFLPQELAGAPALLPAKDSVNISLPLVIAPHINASMSGYRAIVFYP